MLGGPHKIDQKISLICHKLEFSILIRNGDIHYFSKNLKMNSKFLIDIVNKEIRGVGNKLDIYKTRHEATYY